MKNSVRGILLLASLMGFSIEARGWSGHHGGRAGHYHRGGWGHYYYDDGFALTSGVIVGAAVGSASSNSSSASDEEIAYELGLTRARLQAQDEEIRRLQREKDELKEKLAQAQKHKK